MQQTWLQLSVVIGICSFDKCNFVVQLLFMQFFFTKFDRCIKCKIICLGVNGDILAQLCQTTEICWHITDMNILSVAILFCSTTYRIARTAQRCLMFSLWSIAFFGQSKKKPQLTGSIVAYDWFYTRIFCNFWFLE